MNGLLFQSIADGVYGEGAAAEQEGMRCYSNDW